MALNNDGPKENKFGELLGKHRRNSREPEKGGILSQDRLLTELSKLPYNNERFERYTASRISNLESGREVLHQKRDRGVLLGIIQVLRQCGGITSLEEANELLLAGQYSPLSDEEITQVDTNGTWKLSAASTSQQGEKPAPSESGAQINIGRNVVKGNQTFHSGDVYVSGDQYSGDIRVGKVQNSTVGIGHGTEMTVYQNEPDDELTGLFAQVRQQIADRSEDGTVDKEEIKSALAQVERQVRLLEAARPKQLHRWLQILFQLAPDIFAVTAAGLTSPALALPRPLLQVVQEVRPDQP